MNEPMRVQLVLQLGDPLRQDAVFDTDPELTHAEVKQLLVGPLVPRLRRQHQRLRHPPSLPGVRSANSTTRGQVSGFDIPEGRSPDSTIGGSGLQIAPRGARPDARGLAPQPPIRRPDPRIGGSGDLTPGKVRFTDLTPCVIPVVLKHALTKTYRPPGREETRV